MPGRSGRIRLREAAADSGQADREQVEVEPQREVVCWGVGPGTRGGTADRRRGARVWVCGSACAPDAKKPLERAT